MNIWNELKKGTWVPYTVAVCAGVAFYMILINLSNVAAMVGSVWTLVSPLFTGLIIAYLLDPIAVMMERKGVKRKPAVIITLIILFLIAGLFLLELIPQILSGLLQFLGNLTGYISKLKSQIKIWDSLLTPNSDGSGYLSEGILTALDTLAKYFKNVDVLKSSTNIGGGVASFAMSFILAIYYLFFKGKMLTWIKRFLQKGMSEEHYKGFVTIASRCHKILLSYISCSLIEALLVGGVNAIFMLLCGMPYVTIVSLIVGVTNLAPTFGPIVGCILGAFVLLLVKPVAVIPFVIFTLILQVVDGYMIKPKLFGDTLGVSSLLILIFLILGGRLFGVWGILLAIPIAAILQYLCQELLFPHTINRSWFKEKKPAEESPEAEKSVND